MVTPEEMELNYVKVVGGWGRWRGKDKKASLDENTFETVEQGTQKQVSELPKQILGPGNG